MQLAKPLGVQLYTFHEDVASDYIGTLERIAALGLQGIEFFGGFVIPAEELQFHLERLGLQAAGWHIALEDFLERYDETVAYHQRIGNRLVTIPAYPMDTMEDLDRLVSLVNDLSPRLQADGLTLGYHNHTHEFRRFDGRYGLDLLAERCADTLRLELDLYWVHQSGVDPLEYWRQHRSQTNLIHLKDGLGGDNFTALGGGLVDVPALVQEAAGSAVEWIHIENDAPKPSALENVAESVRYLEQL